MTERHLLPLKLLSRAGLAGLAVVVAVGPSSAAPKAKAAKEDAKPALVATFGDWNVFTSRTARGRICYTLAQPKSREPGTLARDPGYAFISDRPAEGVRNEVSFIMGFEVAAGGDVKAEPAGAKAGAKGKAERARPKGIASPVAVVDDASFDLLPKGGNLWVKNAARESALIAEMKKGATLVIKAASLKGNSSTDSYSLDGFSQAMDRLQKECSGKS